MSCSCDLIGFVFTNSSQTCSNNILSFSTTLSYATDDGSITASYIIALLMVDLNNGMNTSLVVDGQNVSVVSDKLFSTSSVTVMFSSDTGLFIGLPFIGFAVAVISGIIITVIAVLV